jgi:hypothetical protein
VVFRTFERAASDFPLDYNLVARGLCNHLNEDKTGLKPVDDRENNARPVEACQVVDRIVLLLQSCRDGVDLIQCTLTRCGRLVEIEATISVSMSCVSPLRTIA